MTNVNANTYKTFGDTTLAVYKAEFASVNSPMLPDVEAIYAALKGYTALALGQMWLENKYATTGIIIRPEDHNPLSLRPWEGDPRATKTGDILTWDTRQKVGTIKVPPYADGAIVDRKGSMMLRFPDWVAGVTEWRRRLFDDPDYKWGAYQDAVTLEQMLAIYAPPKDVHPETGADNADIKYPETVRAMIAKFARMEGASPTTTPAPKPTGEPNVPTYTTVVPGLPGGPLTTDYPIDIRLLDKNNTYQRPGILARSPRRSVQHGNGNGNSTRQGEVNYLLSGAEGRQASYHSVGSYDGVTVCIPMNEVGWHAADGAGPGNMCGWAMEQIEDDDVWADPTLALKTIHVCGDFMGRVAAREACINGPEQHWTFNYADPGRHDCPNKLRHRTVNGKSAWSLYTAEWNAAFASEKARMGGKPVDTTPLKTGDGFAVTESLNLRAAATTGAEVLVLLDAGDTGTITGASTTADGYTWWPVRMADGTSGFVAADWIVKTTSAPTTTQPPAPVYATPLPIAALLATDVKKNDTAEGVITSDGTDFVFVSDVIEVTAETLKVQQRSGDPDAIVAPTMKKGERFLGAWLFEAPDGSFYYLTPAPEWGRVRYRDAEGTTYTKRIADAPLALPGSAAYEAAYSDAYTAKDAQA